MADENLEMVIGSFDGVLTKRYLQSGILPDGFFAHPSGGDSQEFFITVDGEGREEYSAGWLKLREGKIVVTVFRGAEGFNELATALEKKYTDKKLVPVSETS